MASVIINGKEVPSVAWRNEYVMTTETAAYFFDVPVKNIQENFRNNREYFVEGRHYFKIEGDDLKNLRPKIFGLQISPMTRSLILYTRRGIARLAKSINSEVAWAIFELLEDAYFNREIDESKMPGAPFAFERGKQLMRLASHTRDPLLREKLIRQAANLLAGETIVPEIEITTYDGEPFKPFYMK